MLVYKELARYGERIPTDSHLRQGMHSLPDIAAMFSFLSILQRASRRLIMHAAVNARTYALELESAGIQGVGSSGVTSVTQLLRNTLACINGNIGC